MRLRSTNVHPLFLLAAFSGVLFCITTLALLMLPWMGTTTPFLRWLDRNALPLIASEIACCGISGFAAFLFDKSNSPEPPSPTGQETYDPRNPG